MDKRDLLLGALRGSAVLLAGAAIAPIEAIALPVSHLPSDATGLAIEKAQVVVVAPRRRRRWVCWWHRGRRVCGWR